MKLEDFFVMIGLKILVMGYLENNLSYTTPFKNPEKPVKTQALIYLSFLELEFLLANAILRIFFACHRQILVLP